MARRASVILRLAKETILDFREDKASRLAAALSYYTLLSLGPLVLVAVAVAGLFFGREAVGQELIRQFRELVGDAGAEVATAILTRPEDADGGAAAMIVGFILLLVGASGVFLQLQEALNTVWEVPERPGGGIVRFLRKRLVSFGMVLGIAFLLLVSLVVSAALAAAGAWLERSVAVPAGSLEIANFGISFAAITILFALIFKYLPDAQIAWTDVWTGAAATAFLFTIGKSLIGLYLGRSGVGSVYGAAGSIVVLTVWVHYSSLIVLLGAEWTQAWARHRQSGVAAARTE